MDSAEIGIIGGTGVYDPQLLEDVRQIKVHTPYGSTSSAITLGTYQGRKVAFISRHGNNHTIPPHRINFRANIWALKELSVSRVIATAATGSLKEHYRAGDVVIPDQFIDWSKNVHTFYDEGQFYHVSLAEPFCPELRKLLIKTTRNLNIPFHEKGTYLKIDGPQFSTRASSHMYRQFADLIGMTCVPEAILCREKEMCFGCIATITDYDCWADTPVNFEEIKRVMGQNLENTRRILQEIIPKIPHERSCECKDALKGSEV
jgi:5'-methylthioadenosine phosphorylase